MTATSLLVSVQELRGLAASNPAITLLDVRTPAEFEFGRVPSAKNVPLGSLVAERLLKDETVSLGRPFYLICHTESRSRIAAEKFRAAGHTRAFVVAGGMLGWIGAGLPVSRGPSNIIRRGKNPQVRNLRRGPQAIFLHTALLS